MELYGKTMETTANAAVGIIIVAHTDYAAALLRTTEFILGPLGDCTSISVDAAFDVAETVQRLNDAAQLLDKGAGVLILTDMFGGTPTNLSLALLTTHKVEVVTGVNLPMVIKAFSARALPLKELAELVGEAGKQGIVVAGEMLEQKIPKE
jgi:PTS system mannose-specific IIA component